MEKLTDYDFLGLFIKFVFYSNSMFKEQRKKSRVIVVATFSVVFLAVATSSLLTNEAAAAQRILSGNSPSTPYPGTVICPDGSTVNGAGTNFFIDKNSKGQISGSYSIFVLEPSGNIGFDHITKAQISKNNFKFSGIEDFDGICGTSGTGQPTTMSMSGQCGSGVTVHFTDGKGVKATISGVNVACST